MTRTYVYIVHVWLMDALARISLWHLVRLLLSRLVVPHHMIRFELLMAEFRDEWNISFLLDCRNGGWNVNTILVCCLSLIKVFLIIFSVAIQRFES